VAPSRLVVGAQCLATGSVEKVEGFDGFKGGFLKKIGAAVAGDGEKLDDGAVTGVAEDAIKKPRIPTTHERICTCIRRSGTVVG
jgi:hypothetical protein